MAKTPTQLTGGFTSDCIYYEAFFDGTQTHRLSGTRGSAPLLDITVIAGKIGVTERGDVVDSIREDTLVVEDDRFEVSLSPEPRPEGFAGNWLQTRHPERGVATYMIIRQYSTDAGAVAPAKIEIQPVDRVRHREPVSPREIDDALQASVDFTRVLGSYWTAMTAGMIEGLENEFLIVGELAAADEPMPTGHRFSTAEFRLGPTQAWLVTIPGVANAPYDAAPTGGSSSATTGSNPSTTARTGDTGVSPPQRRTRTVTSHLSSPKVTPARHTGTIGWSCVVIAWATRSSGSPASPSRFRDPNRGRRPRRLGARVSAVNNTNSSSSPTDVDLVIVGAGFAGLYMLHAARGIGLTARVIEAGSGPGGTWHWNRYPGARCDVPSFEYSFGFDDDLQQDWEWTERYPTQPEILRYIDHVADRFDLCDGISFDTRVEASHFDDEAAKWTTTTDAGESIVSRFVVMATGCLSAANIPDIEGRDDFDGPIYHTGHWPHEGVDFSGKRVAVVGTGSSGVQSIPLIAEEADHVTVFQRTPAYAVPAHNQMLADDNIEAIKADYPAWRTAARATTTGFGGHIRDTGELVGALEVDDKTRNRIFEERWAVGGLTFMGAFNDLLFSVDANDTAAEFVRSKIRGIVADPDVADRLSPDTVIGCKRMCVDTDYYATYNRDDVDLVDVGETPISRITAEGVEVDGTVHKVDAIVFATGFDAMTGALDRIDIRGRGGLPLKEKWSAGPLTYLGLQVNGFPNLFTITGPGSPSVLTNMIVSIEQHVEWIRDALVKLDADGIATIEADADAEAEWVAYVNMVAEFTLFHGCSSWYLGANVPGKPRVFMPLPGFPEYKQKCDEVVAADYEGFVLA